MGKEEAPSRSSGRRVEYLWGTLEESGVAEDPFQQFADWLEGALTSNMDEPMAMTLATCTTDGMPSARVVLVDEYGEEGFTFYTNYESRKGREIADNPRAAAVFFWPSLERQVRIEGPIEKLPLDMSDEYHHHRPLKSQLGAWASNQSERIESRRVLEDRMAALKQQYASGKVPRPPHWGGYRLIPLCFEFWQGRAHRLNDRILYEKGADDRWRISRLAP